MIMDNIGELQISLLNKIILWMIMDRLVTKSNYKIITLDANTNTKGPSEIITNYFGTLG